MEVCLMVEGQEGVACDQWLALAQTAEASGLDAVFRSDHYRSIHRGDPVDGLDAWTSLAAISARTQRIRVGTLVSPPSLRPASILAKSVVTVDHVSAGRVELGVGAGWFEPELRPTGFATALLRSALTSSSASPPRSTGSGVMPPTSGPSPCSNRARRSSSVVAPSRAPSVPPSRTRLNTTPSNQPWTKRDSVAGF
jgi:hypothetical protein